MSFNVGAFAGALGQSALSTYERIGEEELRAMQRQKLRKEIADEAALDQALKTELGRVGQKDDYTQAIQSGAAVGEKQARALDTMGMEGLTNSPEDQAFKQAAQTSAVSALRENAGASPVQAIEGKEYTQAQALKGYAKAAAGVSRKGYLESLQIKSAAQESDAQDKFLQKRDELSEQLAMIKGIGQTGGMKGLFELGKKEGLELKFNEGKNGVGSRIDVLGPKGDVLKTYSDLESAQKALATAAMDRFQKESMSLLGSPDKYIAAMQGERQVNVKEREVGVKEAIAPSEISKNYGIAGYYSAGGSAMGKPPKKEVTNADFNNFLEKFGDKPSSVIDKKSGKPLPVSALSADQQWTEARKHYNASGAAFAESGDGMPDIGKGGLKKDEPKAKAAIPMDKASLANRESEARLNQVLNARRIAFVGPNDYKKLAEDPSVPADVRKLATQKYQDFAAAQSE